MRLDGRERAVHGSLRADVCVVGAGPAGLAVAATLAEAGARVIVLEDGGAAGRRRPSVGGLPPFGRHYRDGAPRLTADGHAWIATGTGLGGSALVSTGQFAAPEPTTLARWRDELALPEATLAPLPAQIAELGDHLARLAALVDPQATAAGGPRVGSGPSDPSPAGPSRAADASPPPSAAVAPGPPLDLGVPADLLGMAARVLDAPYAPAPRLTPGCRGCGRCLAGCPHGARPVLALLDAAEAAGALFITHCRAERVQLEAGRARAVVAWAGEGPGVAGRPLVVRAAHVVLAAGAYETPLLLAASGVRSAALGRHLALQPFAPVFARMPGLVRGWQAPVVTGAVALPASPGVRIVTWQAGPAIAAALLPRLGAPLTHALEDLERLVCLAVHVTDRGAGRVRAGYDGRPSVRYPLPAREGAALRAGIGFAARLLLAAGATDIYLPLAHAPVVRAESDLAPLVHARVSLPGPPLVGLEPLGSARRAGRRELGVTDPDGRVFDVQNLAIADGSAVPAGLGVPPQATILAFAIRLGHRLTGIA